MNIISEKEDKEFEIVEEKGEYLRDLNTYLPKLMIYLWEEPKIVASIIKNAETNDLQNYLAPFFANNFYENILSNYYIEDNLMYMLTILLKNEIDGLNNINQSENFLKNTPCGQILEELKKRSDIQHFFKNIIFNDVKNLEVNYSSLKFKFKIKNLIEDYNELRNDSKNKGKHKIDDEYLKFGANEEDASSISLEDSNINYYRNKKQLQSSLENFNRKYIPDLTKKVLKEQIEELKDNKRMFDYCYSKLNQYKNDQNDEIYANKNFLENLYKCEYSKELLFQYQNYFTIVINFIDSLLDKIINNAHLLPYSVKCLCKIISLLINKKFPQINEIEKNDFIANFFFGKLLVPILNNPGKEAFINNFIISENTKSNLKLISIILKKLSSGKFFIANEDECDYTPYNWFFLEKFQKVYKIFDDITNVKLPSFIEKFINNELPEDYQYNYFKENPDEVINYRSTCFNLEQVDVLLKTIQKSQEKIFIDSTNKGLQKTFEKLLTRNNRELLEELMNSEQKQNMEILLRSSKSSKISKKEKKEKKEEKETQPEKPKIHFLLYTDLLKNERYQKLFDIDQKTASFSIKELKVSPGKDGEIDNELIKKNDIIKVKNFFCSLLYNYNKLAKKDFDDVKELNTENILKKLNIFMKSSNFVVDGSVPSEWYVSSILEYLPLIPNDLTKNDCEELYNQIEEDVTRSIKELDFEALSVIIGKLKYVRRGKAYFEECSTLLKDIKINEKVKDIIENEYIPVDLKFYFDENENGDFQINPSSFKEKPLDKKKDKDKKLPEKTKDKEKEEKQKGNFLNKIKEYEKSKKCLLCQTIDDFTKRFPNLVKYQELQDADIFEIQNKLKIPSKINEYFNYIDSILEKKERKEIKEIKDRKELDSINDKIYDYVMGKIYDKIYPIEPYEKDNKVFQQSVRLSWTQPKHFIEKKQYVFGSFLSDVLKYFELIDSEKSPKKKMSNMNEIFNSIGFLLEFNGGGKDAGVDDQMPILNYAFIKAQPLRMYSNSRFMELYIGEKKNKVEGSQLTQLALICDFIASLKFTDLFGVTREEFIQKCNDATIYAPEKK